jgi:hypothetical protein
MYYEDLLETAVSQHENHLYNNYNKSFEKFYDKNYERYTILVGKTAYTIENFGSGSHGSRIRNAVTGAFYTYLVGSTDEDKLFKVADSTGRNGRREPLMLFYTCPEEYEQHHMTTLSADMKNKWWSSLRKP